MSKLTKPGATDLQWMHVICTPEQTHVEFDETRDEARELALGNLAPGCSVYVAQVTDQGERRTAPHKVCVVVDIDVELRAALRRHCGAVSRAEISKLLRGLLEADLEQIRSEL